MRTVILGVAAGVGLLLAAVLYQQIVVEHSLGPAATVAVAVLATALLALVGTALALSTRYRDAVLNAWLAVFSVVVSYLVLDLAAGYILIRPLSPPLVADLKRHHKLVPNSFAEFHQQDFAYVQRVNALGLRGKDVSVQKAPGSYRIVMLGDSFTMGKGVEDDQTFSMVLETALKRSGRTCNTPVEIVNGGVDSYAPVLEYIQLKDDLAPLSPDMVVLNLDVSDLVQETAYRSLAERDAAGDIVAVPQHPEPANLLESIRVWSERHMFFTRVALYFANRALGYHELTVRDVVNRADAEIVAHTLTNDVDRTKQWNDIFDSLRHIKAFCDLHHIEFVLTLYPWAHQISDTEWVPGRYVFMDKTARPSDVTPRTVHAMSEANGIALVDMFPIFRAHLSEGPLYFAHDMHWTAAGQRVMALGLEDYLVSRLAPVWCR